MATGTYYVIVQADWRNQVAEGDFGGNEAGKVATSSSTVNVSIPTLTPGTPLKDAFTGPGEGRYYQISVVAGADPPPRADQRGGERGR